MSRDSDGVVLLVQPAGDDGGDMYAEFLRHHRFRSIVTCDAGGALNAASQADVVVTGILLSGDVDGIELIARLRADPQTEHTPIIVVTACAWPSARQRAEEAGCDVFLTKPCLPETLLHEVQRVFAALKPLAGRARSTKAGPPHVPSHGGRQRKQTA